MNLAPEIGANCLPVSVEVLDNVVVAAPIGGYNRIDLSGRAVEEWLGPAIWPAWREDPLKRGKLAAVASEHRFQAGKLLHCCARFAVIADDWILCAVRASVEVCMRRVEIDSAEEMKVAGVGRG
jgi:hypothetical protein